jgi:putative membrane protein
MKKDFRRFLIRWFINALGLWAAAYFISGVSFDHSLWTLFFASLIFSIINATLKPIIIIFSLPAIMVTLGLFMLVVNGLVVYLTGVFYSDLEISSFGAALLAAIVIGVVNYIVSLFIDNSDE